MTQLELRFEHPRRAYHRAYYALNRARRRAQRLASKYAALEEWRLWLNYQGAPNGNLT